MREIKFRAWDKNREEMINEPEFINLEGRDFVIFIEHEAIWEKNDYEGAEFEIMQYTGLKGKNGVEIYEGDIVANIPRFCEIPCHGLHDSAEIVKMKEIEGSDDMGIDCIGYPLYWTGYEIIGNIYENPELLKSLDK